MGHSYSYCPVVGGMHSDNCPPGYGKCCPWTAFVPPAKPAYTAGVPGQYIPDDTSTSDDDDDRDVDRMNNAMVGMGYGNFGKGKGGALEVRDLEALGFVVRGEGEREGDGLVRREAQAQVQVLTVPVAGTILEIPQSTSTSSDIAALDFEGWLIVCFAVLGGIGILCLALWSYISRKERRILRPRMAENRARGAMKEQQLRREREEKFLLESVEMGV